MYVFFYHDMHIHVHDICIVCVEDFLTVLYTTFICNDPTDFSFHFSDLTKVQLDIAQELKQMKKDGHGADNKEYHMRLYC